MKYESREKFLEYLYEYYLIEISDMTITTTDGIENYEGKLEANDTEISWLAWFNTKTLVGIVLDPVM